MGRVKGTWSVKTAWGCLGRGLEMLLEGALRFSGEKEHVLGQAAPCIKKPETWGAERAAGDKGRNALWGEAVEGLGRQAGAFAADTVARG